MLFNSFAFLIFFPVVFLIYWSLSKNLRLQNIFVVVASYIFYGWWDKTFLILIAITTLFSYLSGILITANEHSPTRQRAVLIFNTLLNLGILGMFKYYNFFTTNLQSLLSNFGIELDNITLNLILPVGISFYTFQALSYTIDVYRKKIDATRDIVAFFAFTSFFPQLVAGPIERATNLLPQFLAPRKFSYERGVEGCRQILWGLFKKMVVADNCAMVVNLIFPEYQSLGGINLWLGALFFTFQIYGDFSGYSDIAIGSAKLLGINLMRNFNNPYFSRDIAEFWRKWHISLTTWFRDYLYIPLGGSRCPKSKVVRNTFIIFLVSGFWHGAEWTFIAWGAYHAVLFTPLIISGKNRKHLDNAGSGRILPTMYESLLMGWTFLLVLVGWVIFRADNIRHAWGYISRMFTNLSFMPPLIGKRALLFIAMMICIEWMQRNRPHTFDLPSDGLLRYRAVRWGIYIIFIMLILTLSGSQSDFIYFQF